MSSESERGTEVPVFHEAEVILVQIPRTAGTALVNSGLLGRPDAVGHHSWRWYRRFHPREWDTYAKVAVIRHPVERLKSAYNYAVVPESHWHDGSNPHPDFEICTSFSLDELICAGDIPLRLHPSFRPQAAQLDGQPPAGGGVALVAFERLIKGGCRMGDVEVELGGHVNESSGRDCRLSPEATSLVRRMYVEDFALWAEAMMGPAPWRHGGE